MLLLTDNSGGEAEAEAEGAAHASAASSEMALSVKEANGCVFKTAASGVKTVQ